MPAECPAGIKEMVEVIPLRLTHTALKSTSLQKAPLPQANSILALCDGSVNENDEDVNEDGHEFLPVCVEKGLDSEQKSNHKLSAHEKLERLRMALKKQDAEKKEEVREDVEAAKKEDQKEQNKNDGKNHNTKRNITEKNEKKKEKCDKSDEKKKLKENKQKEKKQDKSQKPSKSKHAKEEAVVPKDLQKKDNGKKRKALSMTKKCYTSRAYHLVYDLAKKNDDPEAKAKARDASYKAGLQWEELYGQPALVSA